MSYEPEVLERFNQTSLVQALNELDEALAYVSDARNTLAELRSAIFDILTGVNDHWTKTQLLALVDAADNSLIRAVQ
jgi:hypothetical protein